MTEKGPGGRDGKRLWLRTNDNRWIDIPYGAGQDPKIRSVNVFDGTQWWSPAFASRVMETRVGVSSLEVALPHTTWIGRETVDAPVNRPYWNPNYQILPGPYVQPYEPMNANWTRLFHVAPRNDPTWRIVALNRQIPIHVPNRTVIEPDELRNFWPSVNMHQVTITDGQVSESLTPANSYLSAPYLALASDEHYPTRGNPGYTNKSINYASLIDLAHIRKRLEDDYEFQNEDFTGQYHSIKNMKLARVLIRAKVSVSATVSSNSGTPPDPALVGSIGLALRSARSVNVQTAYTTDPGGLNKSYVLQFPDSTIAPTSTIPDYATTGAVLQTTVFQDLMYEALDETNLAFFAAIQGLPSISSNVSYAGAIIRVVPQRIALHYADHGHDTPVETHSDPYAIG